MQISFKGRPLRRAAFLFVYIQCFLVNNYINLYNILTFRLKNGKILPSC